MPVLLPDSSTIGGVLDEVPEGVEGEVFVVEPDVVVFGAVGVPVPVDPPLGGGLVGGGVVVEPDVSVTLPSTVVGFNHVPLLSGLAAFASDRVKADEPLPETAWSVTEAIKESVVTYCDSNARDTVTLLAVAVCATEKLNADPEVSTDTYFSLAGSKFRVNCAPFTLYPVPGLSRTDTVTFDPFCTVAVDGDT
jgi:hypothetical protein